MLQGVFIAVVLIYIGRLFHLQVIEQEYKQLANNFSLRRLPVYPARGLVYDRNKKLILYNKAEYDLMVIPLQTKAFDTLELASLLEWDKETVVQTLKKAYKSSPYRPYVFVKGIQADQFVTLREAMYQFPGFYPQVRTVRSYPYNAAAHLLGYIGEVSPKQIEKNPYYRQGDYIGITGIEEYYEKTLRGQKGVKYMLVDVNNREQGRFNDGKYDTLALPGLNLYSSLDIELQKYGEELMRNKIGSVVVIDPSTGEVLAMVSSPTYDPGLLSGKDRGKQFAKLYADTLKPLFNRATKAPYPPGSTFKPLMAAIGMQEGVINPDLPFFLCRGSYFVGNRRIGCHYSAYPTDVRDAISHSCNGYFAHYFMQMVNNTAKYGSVDKGLDTWVAYLKRAGLGVKTGIDLPNEGYGFAPDSKLYDKWYKNQWRGATIVSIGFGQGELSETPLQMANLMCVFANRGYWYIPHMIHQVEGNDSLTQRFKVKQQTGISRDIMEIVVDGMKDVVEEGTARVARIPGITLCGKTGTAENPHGDDHSLFSCFAPMDNPKIAVAVIVENSGYGATWAAPIASLMIEKYLNDTIAAARKPMEQRILEGNLLP